MRKSLLGKIISFILGIVIIFVILVAIVFAVVKAKFGVNLFDTISNVKKLNDKVDEEKLCSNKFGDDDLSEVVSAINAQIPNYATETDGNVNFNLNNSTAINVDVTLSFSDKQIGAIINNLINKTGGIDVKSGDTTLNVQFIEFGLSNIKEDGRTADIKTVLKVDFKPVKEKLNGFPKKYLKKYVPDYVYIVTTTSVTKADNNDIYDYTLTSKSLTLNNLTEKDSEQIVDTLNKLVHLSNVDTLNTTISSAFMRALVGEKTTEKETKGFASSIGADTFRFSTSDNKNFMTFTKSV